MAAVALVVAGAAVVQVPLVAAVSQIAALSIGCTCIATVALVASMAQ